MPRPPAGPCCGIRCWMRCGITADPRLVAITLSRRGARRASARPCEFGFPARPGAGDTRCAWPTGGERVHASLDANVGSFTKRPCRTFDRSSPSRRQIRWSSLLTGVARKPICGWSPPTQRADHHPARLAPAFTDTWVATTINGANVLSRAIVRLCLSFTCRCRPRPTMMSQRT